MLTDVPPGPPTPDRSPGKQSAAGKWVIDHKNAVIGGGLGVVLFALYRRSQASSSATPALTSAGLPVTTSAAMPTAGYDSSVLDSYNQLAGSISTLNDQVQALQASSSSQAAATTSGGTTPPVSTTAPAAPAPATPVASSGASAVQNLYPLGTQVAPNESIISTATDLTGKGGWDLTSLGGVYTYGDAPFYGSAFDQGSFSGAQIIPLPSGGYQINGPSGSKVFAPK